MLRITNKNKPDNYIKCRRCKCWKHPNLYINKFNKTVTICEKCRIKKAKYFKDIYCHVLQEKKEKNCRCMLSSDSDSNE